MALGLAGAALLTGVGSMAALADDAEEVELDVVIAQNAGELTMSVAGTQETLTENNVSRDYRQFTGDLPEVTVTDTRDPDDIDPLVYWYVLGTATDFEGDGAQPDITADHLGWEPELVLGGPGDPGYSGEVSEGQRVTTVMDPSDPTDGLVDTELLIGVNSFSGDVATEGQWKVGAKLFLQTPWTVQPGTYTSTLTLSLFE
jgi:hypothetical protein